MQRMFTINYSLALISLCDLPTRSSAFLRVSVQLQWSAGPVHPTFTCPVLRYMALLIFPSEISWGVIYIDNGGWCHASLPRPMLRRPVIECKTDSAALTMLFSKIAVLCFSTSWRANFCSHRSRMEQRTQVVSHHTLIFSTINTVLCIPRGLQLYNATRKRYLVLLSVSVMFHGVLSDPCFDSVCQSMRM